MLTNYIKIAVRHLLQTKLYSFINILGLAVGITCMLLAVLYIKDERSFDDFHYNNPNLYRITTTLRENKGDKIQTTGGTGQVQGPAFKAQVPGVLQYVRVMGGDIYGDVLSNNKALNLQMLFVDETFFEVFSFNLLRGTPKTILTDINAAVITESTARKFFNSIDVVGKLLQMDADPSAEKLRKPMIITGVVQDPPRNSSIEFDVLFTMKFMQLSFDDTNWLNAYLGTFVVLHPLADPKAVSRQFNKIYSIHAKEQLAENKKSYGYDPEIRYGLQRMTDIHLDPLYRSRGNREGGVINVSNPFFSYLFFGIAAFILFMAAINFINISIGNSLKRAKEVGVRKITGGSKSQIIMQFLIESALLCFFAFVLAIVLIQITLPVFNQLAGKEILFNEAFDKKLLLYFVLILLAIVILTGFYPAYVLSGFKPTEVLYNKQKLSGRNLFGRSLVVAQFSLAVFFVIATLIYYRQMNYVRTKDLGYNPYQVIRTNIKGDREIKPVQNLLRSELAKEPSIRLISFGGDGDVYDVKIGDKIIPVYHQIIDENYIPAVEIRIKAGRNFSPDFKTDTAKSVIVNEAFVRAANFKNPIGMQIRTGDYYDKEIKTIIGVVRDYHFGSLKKRIQPMVMIMSTWYSGGIWVKIDKNKQKQGMAAFERAYKKAMPSAVYDYSFLDELNAKEYVQEQRWQRIIIIATVLSILICALGLFGLSHLATHQRTKEIGIRKVLGASVSAIAALLSKDFVKLVIISIFIASPVAWYVMNNWLQNFAYRIQISWWMFFTAGATAVFIALATISFQTVKAAMMNPVRNLRTE